MIASTGSAVQERLDVNSQVFLEEIVPAGKPTVLRGLVSAWPAVRAASVSVAAVCGYLKQYDTLRPVDVSVGSPSIQGKFFYKEDDLGRVNFSRASVPISTVLDQLQNANGPDSHSIAVQSLPIPLALPGFEHENRMPLQGVGGIPRIWIGNPVVVQTHLDYNDNVACVVAGRRRFTLFPPEQITNLYIGPIENTPGGAPVSMVPLDNSDMERYPRFAEALAASQTAELGPGDAIYVPYAWWHHVRSLEPFNILVNYWWNDTPPAASSPFNCLLHALLALRTLSPRQREIWKTIFDHYIFNGNAEALEYLKPGERGVLGTMNPDLAQHIKKRLLKSLEK